MNSLRLILLLVVTSITACSSFPVAPESPAINDALAAQSLFERSITAHGGDLRDYPGDINLATEGRWYGLIQRIQPVVSDAGFRVSSEERFRPSEDIYAARHQGPEGSKLVLRTPAGLSLHYNGREERDPERLRATAMTHDAFRLFHFGPSMLVGRIVNLQRMSDRRESGRNYRLLLATLRPGFGESDEDQVVLWLDAETDLLYRVHLTLEGFETTRGAHVDTTFLEYRQVGPYLLPVRFSERVRGPIRIPAHDWQVTGIDLDRGWGLSEVNGAELTGAALQPALPLPQ